MGVKLLIVDPQMDFMDRDGEPGALAVSGADSDMKRLTALIRAKGAQISEIYATLDTHDAMDISHARWWSGPKGERPAAFARLSPESVERGEWRAARAEDQERGLSYLKALKNGGRREHTIWPEHCVKGTPGHRVHPELMEALSEWEAKTGARVSWVVKGENPFTESFSGFKAEVPDPADPKTMMNTALAEAIVKDASAIWVAGEALSHCVAETTRDLADAMPQEALGKLIVLTDACSSVAGCEAIGAAFVEEMLSRGARAAATDSPDEELGLTGELTKPEPRSNTKIRAI